MYVGSSGCFGRSFVSMQSTCSILYDCFGSSICDVCAYPSTMPKRRQPPETDNMRISQHPCVSLGRGKQLVPIPLIQECGVTCVAINSHDGWLNRVVADRCRGDSCLVVKEFVDDLIRTLGRERETPEENTERSVCSDAGVSADIPVKGRAAMHLDSDSDEGVLAETPVDNKPRRKRHASHRGSELQTVSFRGLEITAKTRDKGRGVAVPLDGASLSDILLHLRQQASAGSVPKCDETKAKARAMAAQCRDDADAGRVRWVFGECSYHVMYTDAEGQHHRTNKGLKVGRFDASGGALTGGAFQKARERMLRKARALWNELDRSDAQRYELTPTTE